MIIYFLVAMYLDGHELIVSGWQPLELGYDSLSNIWFQFVFNGVIDGLDPVGTLLFVSFGVFEQDETIALARAMI